MVADYVTSDTQTPSVLDRVTSEPHGILNIRNRLAVYCRRNSHRLHGSVSSRHSAADDVQTYISNFTALFDWVLKYWNCRNKKYFLTTFHFM